MRRPIIASMFAAVLSASTTALGREEVIVVTGEPGLALHLAENEEGLSPACVAPCEVERRRGVYRVGVATSSHDPIATPDILDVRGTTRIRIHATSNAATRTLGWVLLVGGPLLGGGMAATGGGIYAWLTHPHTQQDNAPATGGEGLVAFPVLVGAITLIITGGIVALAGLVEGASLAWRPDRASFTKEAE